MRWTAGDAILLREVLRGRIWTARPATVASDRNGTTAAYQVLPRVATPPKSVELSALLQQDPAPSLQ